MVGKVVPTRVVAVLARTPPTLELGIDGIHIGAC
jgi:hypothetical protein